MDGEWEIRSDAEVKATPEQVWQALASGPGLNAWFSGAIELQPGPGGTLRSTTGEYTDELSVTAWEPGRRVVYRSAEGADNRFYALEWLVEGETYNRTGVSIMGKRMFDGGEQNWPEEAPFHTPVFVVTTERREPWERPGGTTFHFVDDGIESALEQARSVTAGKDIRIAGGAHVIQQYLNAGLVDEFSVAVSP